MVPSNYSVGQTHVFFYSCTLVFGRLTERSSTSRWPSTSRRPTVGHALLLRLLLNNSPVNRVRWKSLVFFPRFFQAAAPAGQAEAESDQEKHIIGVSSPRGLSTEKKKTFKTRFTLVQQRLAAFRRPAVITELKMQLLC